MPAKSVIATPLSTAAPARIQPGGIVAFLDHTDRVIAFARGIDGVAQIALGQPLPDALIPEAGEQVIRLDGRVLEVRFFPAGRLRGVEITPLPAAPQTMRAQAAAGLDRIVESDSPDTLAARLADALRALLGHDRVLIYRPLAGGINEVFAESQPEGAESWLNARFSTASLPPGIAALTAENPSRVIADIDAPEVDFAVLPGVDAGTATGPLDLGAAMLRPVTEATRQIMRAAQLRAMAGFALTHGDETLAVAVARSEQPVPVSALQRSLAGQLVTLAAHRLHAMTDSLDEREFARLRTDADLLLQRNSGSGSFSPEGLARWVRLFDADQMHILYGETRIWGGTPPSGDFSDRLEAFLAGPAFRRGELFHTQHLSTFIQMDRAESARFAGMLAIRMATEPPLTVCAFRHEAPRPPVLNPPPAGRRIPRFAEELRLDADHAISKPWTPAQLRVSRIVLREIVIEWQNGELTASNAELARALDQIRMLSDEMHHRVKNSLQLIASFLSAQMRDLDDDDARQALVAARNRVMAVGLIQRRLYARGGETSIRLDLYLRDLVTDILATLDPGWEAETLLELAPVTLPNDKAIQIGLILNEIVTNTAKHAYNGAPGPVAVSLRANGDHLRLEVTDRGRGLDAAKPAASPGDSGGYGSQIIQAFCEQLGATLTVGPGPDGTGYRSRLDLAL